ncbi:peptidase M23-like protein [Breznakibacter xylanolyticus]|uniref:Peptidase M23-like protein n=1 Tax=Breznakibacter xylanolyticus TaxID=990 RepID=A0A2W7MZQ6_9BACT|nr:M23 family metallopeptidase [Breznakibacter xylanolyticus]PZX13063.1 peptidase M23-like protein [Breznakibacter xylanolyticus]
MRKLWSLSLMFAVAMLHAQQFIPNTFRPPLDISPVINGTFAEIRSNHFHSGIDYGVGGKIGNKIFAIGDGDVSRVKVQSGGYGKALYVTHPNGYTSVYAHLDRYAPRIDSLVIASHYHRQQFDMDVTYRPGEMTVKQGEVIGYVGNTGSSSGAHLHFEIRGTNDEKPIDPLLFMNNVKDNVPPVISGIRIYPIDNGASVAGKGQAKYYKAVLVNGTYRLEGNLPVSANGNIGIGIETIDYLTGSWRKCGIYSIEMIVDEATQFKAELNRFSFDQTRYVNSFIDFGYKISTGKVIHKCFVDAYNALDVYRSVEEKGVIKISKDGIKTVLIKVRDTHGNESVLAMKLKGDGVVAPKSNIAVISGDKPLVVEKENIKVNIPENAFYSDVPFSVTSRGEGMSKIYSVGQRTIPLHQFITVNVRIPEALLPKVRYLCLAKVNGKSSAYAGGVHKNGWLSARVRELGDYQLAIDSVAPAVTWHNAAPQGNYAGRKTLELIVKDNFSGIASFRCEIDGNWALFEYDGKTNRLICPLNRIPITKNKKHSLKVVVVDGLGNETVRNLAFHY